MSLSAVTTRLPALPPAPSRSVLRLPQRPQASGRRPMTDAQLRAVWMLRCAQCTHEPRGDARCQRDLNRLGDALHEAFAALRWERVAPPVLGECGAISLTRDEGELLRATSAIQHDLGREAGAIVERLAGGASPYLLGEVVVLLASVLGSSGYWLPEPQDCALERIALPI